MRTLQRKNKIDESGMAQIEKQQKDARAKAAEVIEKKGKGGDKEELTETARNRPKPINKSKGGSQAFKTSLREELKVASGYYRPKYETNFDNDCYRYNKKFVDPKLHGKVLMQDDIGYKDPRHPKKLDERSIRRMAEISLGLRQNRGSVDVRPSKKMQPHFTRSKDK